MSFIVAWVGDWKHQIAVSGSANFFLTIGGDKRFVSMLKIGGLYDLVKTPLAYAWIDTAAYGKTSGFSAYAGDETEKSMFLAGKNGDAKGFALPLSMATAGFTLGVSFGQQTIDNVVDVPAADPSVVAKVRDCSQALAARVKAMSGQ